MEIVNLLDAQVIPPPPITKHTLELGTKYSPDVACVPYKYTMGNFLESIEKGANLLLQAGGASCRYQYYGEVQEVALHKLGYNGVTILRFTNSKASMLKTLMKFKKLNPRLTYRRMIHGFAMFFAKIYALDKIETFIRQNVGFQEKEGEMEGILKQFLSRLNAERSLLKISKIKNEFLQKLQEVKINKPANPIRVAVVGEFYVTIEPFSNFFVERELGKKGIEVYRNVDLTAEFVEAVNRKNYVKNELKQAKPYLKYHVGAHATKTIATVLELIHEGYDGFIHVKPFGCVPEVNAMSALHKISKDFKVPIIYFSFDSQTSETGVKTRLEAFYDMLKMKKEKESKKTI